MPRHALRLRPVGARTPVELRTGLTKLAIGSILPRKGTDTRPLSASHVVGLAANISLLGLLEPIVVDTAGHLLAGAHRLAALQLLAIADPDERRATFLGRLEGQDSTAKPTGEAAKLADQIASLDTAHFSAAYPGFVVPVNAIEILNRRYGESDKALAIEAAENTARRQYSPAEVRALADRLQEAGYTHKPGKPKAGEKPAIPVLEAALGLSRRQIQKVLNTPASAPKPSEVELAKAAFRRAAARLMKLYERGCGPISKDLLLTARTVVDRLKVP